MDTNLFKKVLEPYGKIKKVEYETQALNLLKTKREKLIIKMVVTKNSNHEARHCDTGRKSYSQAVGGSSVITLAIDTLKEIVNEAERNIEEERHKKKRERKGSEDSDKIKKYDKLKRLKKRIKPNVNAARVYQMEQKKKNITAENEINEIFTGSMEAEEDQECYSGIPPDNEGEEKDPSNQNTNFTPIL
ncbi:hypothetical protein GHT06_004565 [Daphnia sinensis]|uniref:Uncharacterized protein n=1 Tax=Daphnia sinensis TaxID=1820382 RepID=A0AAD5KVP6_9CRUS|nr:hypothetical protein GHT06_004565 [Daphnia sinensis]